MRNVLQDGDVKAFKENKGNLAQMMIFVGAFNGNGFKHRQNEALKTSHAYDTILMEEILHHPTCMKPC